MPFRGPLLTPSRILGFGSMSNIKAENTPPPMIPERALAVLDIFTSGTY